jgi:secretion/DNA translocation related CpaE-like protein
MTDSVMRQRAVTDVPPLLLSADEALVTAVTAVAEQVGTRPTHVRRVGEAGGLWDRAPFVLLGLDAAPTVSGRLSRRAGVVLVTADPDDAGVWSVAADIGAEFVAVLPDAAPWLPEVLRPLLESAAASRRRAPVVAVAGGRGGAGASALAVALGVASARAGNRTLLLDLDAEGGGLDLLLGAEEHPGVRWPGLAGLRGRVDPAVLLDAVVTLQRLPAPLHLVSADREPARFGADAVRALLESVAAAVELTVVDLGRVCGPAADAALAATDRCLLIVPRETRAAVGAARVKQRLQAAGVPVELVVRGPAPAGLSVAAVEEMIGMAAVASLRPDGGLAAALDVGEPVPASGPLGRFAADWVSARRAGSGVAA